MNFATFDRWQRAKSCIVLHDADAFDVAKEDIRLMGDKYQRPKNNVRGMIRVVNAKRALKLYLQQPPETNTVIRVEDDHDIPMNNAYYILANGKVKKTDEPDANATRLRIEQLADFIFGNEQAEMTLMLN